MADTQANGDPAAAAPPAAAPPPSAPSSTEDPNWRFIPAQPMREDQVQNAVNFLSHPKVKNSPVVYRRSFLERKGLSREEIDEAFRRVPDPPSSSGAPQVPAAPAAAAAVPVPVTALVPRRGVTWSQVALAIGLLSAAGAGAAVVAKKYFYPRLKTWLRRIVLDDDNSEPRLDVEESKPTAALTAATVEIAAFARELVSSRLEERRYLETLVKSMEAQSREMKTSLDTLIELQRRTNPSETNGYKGQISRNGKVSGGASVEPVRPSSAPYTSDAGRIPPSAKYSEILAMIERGEKPPGIRDVNDKPPNPTQPASNSALQPKAKPWESYAASENGVWWRQGMKGETKNVDNSVQIVEIEDQDMVGSDGVFNAAAQTTSKTWIPPPVPKISLSGADAAIRHSSPTPTPHYSYPRGSSDNVEAGVLSSSEIGDASPSSDSREIVEGSAARENTLEVREVEAP